jgi:hypothetical protein
MISLVTLPISRVRDGSYRDTWDVFDEARPKAAQTLLCNLIDHVREGATLPIHVAELTAGEYVVVDGHFCLDVYRYLNTEQVSVIVHHEIKDERAARIAYISMNYLRSDGWLRDAVITRDELASLGEATAVKIMADPELARDLVNRDDSRWMEFKSVFEDAERDQRTIDFFDS